MSITEIAIKRPSLILVGFIVLTVLGLISYSRLSYELIPKFSAPVIFITTTYPGASPTEVENNVTKPIEDAISGVEKIINIRSTSYESLSLVAVEFKQTANVDLALQEAQRKINGIQALLPADAKAPVISKFASDEFPIMNIAANADLPQAQLYDLMKLRVKPALSRVEGVGQVTLVGGQEREVQVLVNRAKLEQYKMSLLQVVQAIQAANLDFPTGKIKSESEQILVRLAGKLETIDDLKALPLFTLPSGASVKLGDVADVQDVTKEAENLNRLNSRTAIGILIQKQNDANAVAVSDGVQKEMAKLEGLYPTEKLKFEVGTDSTDFTREAVDAVVHDIGMAVLLVALVMLVFLHSLRNSVIILVAIPASIVATFIGMYLFEFTLNLMTLLAMSLVIGILVDDSIVVLENIYRHLEMGKDRRTAALEGRNEIGFTALSITLVDVVVFIPIALAGGIVGNIMGQFAWVVVFSTLMSLVVSFTLTPMFASRFSKLENLSKKNLVGAFFIGFEKMLHYLNNRYVAILKWSLNHKAIVLLATALLFFGSFGLVGGGYIGTAFFGNSDRGEFIIQIELPKDATLKETNLAAQKVETLLAQKPEVTNIFTTVGRTTGLLAAQSTPYIAEITVKMVPKDERDARADVYASRVRNELERQLPGIKVSTNLVSFFGGADEAPIQVIVSATELDRALAYANELLEKVKKVPGTLEADLTVKEGNPEIDVRIDRERMAELGLDMLTVGGTMQTAFSGNTNAKFRDGANEYDINVILDAFDRRSLADIGHLSFLNQRGEVIRLEQFADITQATGPTLLERKDRIASVTLKSRVLGRPSGTVGGEIQDLIAQSPPPAGVSISYDGDLKAQEEGFGSLGLAFISAILFVYLIMVALYDNWVYPFVVLFSIPLAIVGALWAMALAMQTLDIFSIVGIIMLIGLVGKNAILLVDFANQLKEEGYSTFDSLVLAGRIRLRPILMTTIAMVFGMLPIALADGAGSEWKNGLAWALIGGLVSSMLLTLVVVPAVYYIMDWIKGDLRRQKRDGTNTIDDHHAHGVGHGVPDLVPENA
ncbi:MAG: efflux RND transporter permease subunit [Saprospirales bacterium]|nr:efflux RND transporter permease subunit [Saprospirales bacterium]